MAAIAQMLSLRVLLAIRHHGERKQVMTTSGDTSWAPARAQVNSTLVKALARAFRWRRLMEAGRFATIDELAGAEKINSSYVSRLLRLTLLAPDLVEAILDGQQADGMTLPGLMEPFPVEWERQRSHTVAETVESSSATRSGALACASRRSASALPGNGR